MTVDAASPPERLESWGRVERRKVCSEVRVAGGVAQVIEPA